MGLNIKNPETERLARELAHETGESVTRAIHVAVGERLRRLQEEEDHAVRERMHRVREIARDASARWVEPYRSADHGDLLYDNAGLPR